MDYEPLYSIIRHRESLRLKPYLCPTGIPTIGYGHTAGVTLQSPPFTPGFAEVVMQYDASLAILQALKLSPSLGSHHYKLCAIADFIFNLGAGRYKASTLKRKVDVQDWEAVKKELRKWVWGGGKKLPGLILRREDEIKLLVV